ncbi:NADH:ubiquinone reductase (Na(+)-transporting) subunit C [Nafulsella turpanensis]|uniref:NADH:ubiquinone reductase (Na(+)-transporting) subunit C n=1 Tax=Nafulsella turpanensis TaxID=1265690 RepID=UPI000344B046|nr:NADH:ubiquinone reductase (Na(+)-transporting) subunit C [Nafulsella turpanensis]
MRQSNAYVIGFAAILTVVLGGLLALAATGLRDKQAAAERLDTRTKILSAVMEIEEGAPIDAIWEERIRSLVVDFEGNVVTALENGEQLVAEKLDIGKEFDKAPEDRLFPVYKFMNEENPEKVDAYIIPMYGNGLWDNIWAFVALEPDLVTVRGVRFDHQAETPGLGARITDAEVQARFEGKKIYNDLGELVSIEMVKGETGDPSIYDDYHVDGLSGATLTAKGVNAMLEKYFAYYEPYFKTIKTADDSEVEEAAESI